MDEVDGDEIESEMVDWMVVVVEDGDDRRYLVHSASAVGNVGEVGEIVGDVGVEMLAVEEDCLDRAIGCQQVDIYHAPAGGGILHACCI